MLIILFLTLLNMQINIQANKDFRGKICMMKDIGLIVKQPVLLKSLSIGQECRKPLQPERKLVKKVNPIIFTVTLIDNSTKLRQVTNRLRFPHAWPLPTQLHVSPRHSHKPTPRLIPHRVQPRIHPHSALPPLPVAMTVHSLGLVLTCLGETKVVHSIYQLIGVGVRVSVSSRLREVVCGGDGVMRGALVRLHVLGLE